MSFNPLPEEQQHPELISRLQEYYSMKTEDRESLASVEQRLFPTVPTAQPHDSPSESEDLATYQSGNVLPINHARPRSQRHSHLNMIAAVFMAVLLTGAIVSTLAFMRGKNPLPIITQPTATSQATAIGQATATAQPTPATPEPRTLTGKGTYLNNRGIFMVTAQVSWAEKTIGKEKGPVFRTADGGKTWQQVVLPQEMSELQYEVYVFDADMAFLIPLQGNNFQSHFYRTIDGGGTWQRSNWPAPPRPPSSSEAISLDWTFLDHLHGWVGVNIAPCCNGTDRGQTLSDLGGETLFQTQDGGLTWQQITRLTIKYPENNLTFTTPQTGWLTTSIDDPAHPNLSDPASLPPALLVTHDGGRTWNQQPLTPPQGFTTHPYIYRLTFFTESKGYLSTGIGAGKYYLYMTQDGGNSWQIQGPALPAYGLDVVDATHLDSIIDFALFALSHGQWVQISNAPLSGSSVIIVAGGFLTSQLGLALVNDSDVYKTTDGGKTWQKIATLPVGT